MSTSNNYEKIVSQAREAFVFGKTRSIKFRKAQLKGLLRLYRENEAAFVSALAQDLRKPRQESILMELNMLKNDVVYALQHIDEWAKPQKVPSNLVTMFDQCIVFNDPYGVVLIMGAWNYPLQLPLLPLSGAIAAGNCAVIKPSEVSPATADLIAKLIPKYLDKECYPVVSGGVAETTELLKIRFDHIFYTGSSTVGKIVRRAANEYLTPTTLELGGKSPVYLDDSVDLEHAVRRIMWGKLINLGQTCVAPDYLICSKNVQDKFIAKAKAVVKEWYGDNPKDSPDLGRIVAERHVKRISEFLKDGEIVLGGNFDVAERWIEPTIIVNAPFNSKLLTEEIFGPVLPIVTIENIHDVIKFVNSRELPLSFYVFTNNGKTQELLQHNVQCGSMCVNDTILQLSIHELPFGGVGHSGMGAYHGKTSFDTFTHKKSCLIRNYNKIADYIGSHRYPPYSERKTSFLSYFLKQRRFPSLNFMPYLFAFAVGAVSLYAVQELAKNGSGSLRNK